MLTESQIRILEEGSRVQSEMDDAARQRRESKREFDDSLLGEYDVDASRAEWLDEIGNLEEN